MVYCTYCGEKNKDNALKCRKCGKPLSLILNDYPENWNSNRPNYTSKNDLDKEFKKDYQNNQNNLNRGSIKSRYNDSNIYENPFDTKNYGNNQSDNFNKLSRSQSIYYSETNRKNLKKANKNYVEWDVVVATALLVIIIASLLQRFFPRFGLSMALLIGLIYILISTKSKSSLFKAIPLAILMVFAISAYFSLS